MTGTACRLRTDNAVARMWSYGSDGERRTGSAPRHAAIRIRMPFRGETFGRNTSRGPVAVCGDEDGFRSAGAPWQLRTLSRRGSGCLRSDGVVRNGALCRTGSDGRVLDDGYCRPSRTPLRALGTGYFDTFGGVIFGLVAGT